MRLINKLYHFKLFGTSNKVFDSRKIKKNLIIYFYPKDNTPGCTLETKDFSKYYKSFLKLNCEVVGISKDTISSHKKFKKKYKVPFDLLSDSELKVQKKFKVWAKKKFMGREFLGTVRSTFFIKKKKIAKEWRNVRVKEHAREVLKYVEEN